MIQQGKCYKCGELCYGTVGDFWTHETKYLCQTCHDKGNWKSLAETTKENWKILEKSKPKNYIPFTQAGSGNMDYVRPQK